MTELNGFTAAQLHALLRRGYVSQTGRFGVTHLFKDGAPIGYLVAADADGRCLPPKVVMEHAAVVQDVLFKTMNY